MAAIDFTVSDTIAGYVTQFNRDADTYSVKTSDGRPWEIRLRGHTYAQIMRNLDDPYFDCTAQMREHARARSVRLHLRDVLPRAGRPRL